MMMMKKKSLSKKPNNVAAASAAADMDKSMQYQFSPKAKQNKSQNENLAKQRSAAKYN